MSSAILMKSGYETGATFVGHSDFELGDDVISKLHYGNFTFYSKAVVTNPKNIIIAENVFCQGYVRGDGVRFFDVHTQDNRGAPRPGGPAGARHPGVAVPNGYHPENGEHTRSLISVVIPYGSGDMLPNPLDIEGHTAYDVANPPREMDVTAPGGVKPSYYMDANWVSEWFQLHEFSRDRLDVASEPFITYEKQQNTVCYRGHQFSYDPSSQTHTSVTVNTGHWGKNIYPGCGAVRAGEVKYLESQRFNPRPQNASGR